MTVGSQSASFKVETVVKTAETSFAGRKSGFSR
jgi:hypothetical protein